MQTEQNLRVLVLDRGTSRSPWSDNRRGTHWHIRMQRVMKRGWLLLPKCIVAQSANLKSHSTAVWQPV